MNAARELALRARSSPNRPGVYVFRDAAGEILYVGKAKSLRHRLRSYFGRQADRSPKLRELARRADSVETFVLDSEAEALLLESNLIKEHRPRFNIQFRDDKTFPYVKVTIGEAYPRVLVTRRLEADGSRYFGPFTDVGSMRRALRAVVHLHSVRSCHYDLPREAPPRPCLDYFIDRCHAPCVGYQTEREYRESIDQVLDILSGRTSAVKRSLRDRMAVAAEQLEYERAAELRDILRGVSVLERRQTTIDFRGGDRDVLGVFRREALACCVILRVREGRLLGREVHYLDNTEQETMADVTAAAVKGFYLPRSDIPPELLVPADFEDRELAQTMLAERGGRAFRLRAPQRGRKRRLVVLACQNAKHLLSQRAAVERPDSGPEAEQAAAPPASLALAEDLGLAETPRSVLCFDISTLGGSESVGSAVWFRDGRPDKNEYRRFRIRGTPEGHSDDYAMMQEVVARYFHRRVAESRPLPDLVVVDGGKGQLAAAVQAMESAGVSDLPAVSLAKRDEEIYRPGRSEPLRLPGRHPGLQWLQRARNEAHRFAVEYHRHRRRRRTLRSTLRDIPGVGPARESELLRRFGSVEAIRRLDVADLSDVRGIGPATARRILTALAAEE